MPTVHAIFENGVFRPTEPVDLEEATEVAFEPRVVDPRSPLLATVPNR
jgi:predicted DNA-binding antitoxin AbrB/MazE fold protein